MREQNSFFGESDFRKIKASIPKEIFNKKTFRKTKKKKKNKIQ